VRGAAREAREGAGQERQGLGFRARMMCRTDQIVQGVAWRGKRGRGAIYIYIYIYILPRGAIYIYIYICIYRERESE